MLGKSTAEVEGVSIARARRSAGAVPGRSTANTDTTIMMLRNVTSALFIGNSFRSSGGEREMIGIDYVFMASSCSLNAGL
jgi:hypothetical protein